MITINENIYPFDTYVSYPLSFLYTLVSPPSGIAAYRPTPMTSTTLASRPLVLSYHPNAANNNNNNPTSVTMGTSTLNNLRSTSDPSSSSFLPASASTGKAYNQFNSGYSSVIGGNGQDALIDARKKSLQRRPSAMLFADGGFNSFRAAMFAGWRAEIMSARFRQAVIAELVATTIFVAIGTLSVVFTHLYANPSAAAVSISPDTGISIAAASLNFPMPRWMGISLVFGLLICVLVFATGAISGANINPAVTVSLLLTRKMSPLRAVFYIMAQCAGACLGAAFAKSLSPDLFVLAGGAANMLSTSKNWVSLHTALGGEMLGTGLLVFTVCAAADVGRERSNKYVGALTPLMIGFAVLNAHLILIPIDGCGINPARSLGSAVLLSGDHPEVWKDHWVFWVGPLIGGPVAALMYEFIFSTNIDDTAVPSLAAVDASKGPGISLMGMSLGIGNNNNGSMSQGVGGNMNLTSPSMDSMMGDISVSNMDPLDGNASVVDDNASEIFESDRSVIDAGMDNGNGSDAESVGPLITSSSNYTNNNGFGSLHQYQMQNTVVTNPSTVPSSSSSSRAAAVLLASRGATLVSNLSPVPETVLATSPTNSTNNNRLSGNFGNIMYTPTNSNNPTTNVSGPSPNETSVPMNHPAATMNPFYQSTSAAALDTTTPPSGPGNYLNSTTNPFYVSSSPHGSTNDMSTYGNNNNNNRLSPISNNTSSPPSLPTGITNGSSSTQISPSSQNNNPN